jgi:hypothetical protein
MATYTLLEIWKPRPEWYALPNAHKRKFIGKIRETLGTLDQSGAKLLGLWRCRATSERGWDVMAYWQFPSFQAIEELIDGNEKFGWNRYFEQINMVGKSITAEEWCDASEIDTEL